MNGERNSAPQPNSSYQEISKLIDEVSCDSKAKYTLLSYLVNLQLVRHHLRQHKQPIKTLELIHKIYICRVLLRITFKCFVLFS